MCTRSVIQKSVHSGLKFLRRRTYFTREMSAMFVVGSLGTRFKRLKAQGHPFKSTWKCNSTVYSLFYVLTQLNAYLLFLYVGRCLHFIIFPKQLERDSIKNNFHLNTNNCQRRKNRHLLVAYVIKKLLTIFGKVN